MIDWARRCRNQWMCRYVATKRTVTGGKGQGGKDKWDVPGGMEDRVKDRKAR